MTRLQKYSWPGNVRELQNMIERAEVLTQGLCITLDDFPRTLWRSNGNEKKPYSPGFAIYEVQPLNEAVDAFQREMIRKALAETCNNQTEAAKLLNMKQPSLSQMMKRLGLR